MKRKMIMLILVSIFGYMSWYINNQIKLHNMDYYQGKDNGAFAQFESICCFGVAFFGLMSKRKRILNAFLGLGLAIITAIAVYFTVWGGLLFSILSGLILIGLFFIVERLNIVERFMIYTKAIRSL